MSWTEKRIETLKKLCAQGKSASEIASALTKDGFTVTRSAVMGKIHRLKIKMSSAGLKQKPAKAPAPKKAAKPAVSISARNTKSTKQAPAANDTVPQQPSKVIVAISGPTTIMTLTDRMCKWPESDPRLPDFHFCGQPSEAGKPYCTTHAALAYQPARRRDDERRARFRIGQR